MAACRAPSTDDGPGSTTSGESGSTTTVDAGCLVDDDCYDGWICDVESATCLRCDPGNDLCPAGEYCDGALCRPGCKDGDCPDDLHCDPDSRECAVCVTDDHCDGLVCAGPIEGCVVCVGNSDCESGVCLTGDIENQCVECISDSNCENGICLTPYQGCGCWGDEHCAEPTPVCDTLAEVCVECLSDEHCTEPTPTCDPVANVCVRLAGGSDHSRASPKLLTPARAPPAE